MDYIQAQSTSVTLLINLNSSAEKVVALKRVSTSSGAYFMKSIYTLNTFIDMMLINNNSLKPKARFFEKSGLLNLVRKRLFFSKVYRNRHTLKIKLFA